MILLSFLYRLAQTNDVDPDQTALFVDPYQTAPEKQFDKDMQCLPIHLHLLEIFCLFKPSAKTQSGWTLGFHFCQKIVLMVDMF